MGHFENTRRSQEALAGLTLGALLATVGASGGGAHQAVHYQFADQTPVPADLWPLRLDGMATGQDLVDPLQEFVVTAGRLQRTLAILPVDDADERLVEAYIRAHAPARPGRRLLRKVTRQPPDDVG